ncbi:MAG: PTPA-CTERM sorting domain-containing protein [Synechococcales cyanobacterium M58_A2018_015]|nr:PTPA-CTERM sorting domain-containing protein [Synechococcales cyanobacterium M58_A2018_015]
MSLISKILKPLAGAAALTAIATVAAQPADAFTFTFGGSVAGDNSGLTTAVSGAHVVTFNDIPVGTAIGNNDVLPNPPSALPFTLPNGVATYSAPEIGGRVGRVVVGNETGRFRAPGQVIVGNPPRDLDPALNNLTNYLTLGSPLEPGPVTISFRGPARLNYFGLYLGSIDGFNSIRFFNGATQVARFTGGDLLRALGDTRSGRVTQYVNFFASNRSQLFDRIQLISASPSLESDNHAFRVVPTPALVPAALGFAGAMLRKRKKEAGVKA